MRFSDLKFLTPIFEMASDALDSLKSALASKIKTLPADESTVKTLREIEDLLRDVNAGGRSGMINKQLQSVGDPTVIEAQRMLSRYILSIDASPEQRSQLFDLWRSNKIVQIDQLLSGERVGFSEVFTGYDANPLIQELVDDLMKISALGHGKGEFGLSVLSKSVTKPASGKGDLLVKQGSKNLQVEVKTADVGKKGKMSSARFGDQEVVPGDGYEEASRKLNDFVRKKSPKGSSFVTATSGISLKSAIEFKQILNPADQNAFMGLVRNSIKIIFGKKFEGVRKEYKARLMKNINGVISSIEKGDLNGALQAYSRASFNYYMAAKHDDGVLFINLAEGTMIYYDSAEDLQEKGLRLNAYTIYLSGADPKRTVYPQIEVTPRTYGADVAKQELQKTTKKVPDPTGKAAAVEKFKTAMLDWATKFANMRGVKDRRTIQQMAIAATELRIQNTPTDQVIAELEKQFPALQVQYARPVPQVQRLYTPYVPPTTTDDEEV